MRTIASTLFLVLLLTTAAWAQSGGQPRHPQNAKATLLGSFTTNLTHSTADTKGLSTLGDGQGGLSIMVTVFRSEERIDYVPILESVVFTGSDDWVDSKPTPVLFEMIAKSAISQGLLLGYETCPAECTQASHKTRVYLPSCVKRIGSGIATTFLDCNPLSNCIREYIVCCPNGIEAPVTEQVYMYCGSCSGDLCESTCP